MLQGKPALWNSILQPEDNADDVEHFHDIPDSPTHGSPHESTDNQRTAEEQVEPAGSDEDEDEEDEEGDMEPSTSGREGLLGSRGPVQGSGPAGAAANAPVGYDMRKRCAVCSSYFDCCMLHLYKWMVWSDCWWLQTVILLDIKSLLDCFAAAVPPIRQQPKSLPKAISCFLRHEICGKVRFSRVVLWNA